MQVCRISLRQTLSVFLAVIFTITCVIYMLNRNKDDVKRQQAIFIQAPPQNFLISRYEQALKKIAKNGNIFLAIVDYSHADFARNLYLTSFRRLSIDNYLFVALNAKCCDVLEAWGINCLHYFPDSNIDDAPSQVKSASFNLKTNARARIVLDALKLGYNPFLVDLDIVFISDPGPIVYDLGLQHELVVQDDGGGQFNTGFYYARVSQTAIDFFEIANRLSQSSMANKMNDQGVMRHILNANLSKIEIYMLDARRFVTGLDYWETKQISFNYVHPWIKQQEAFSDSVIVHNNYIATKEAKIYRFKEALLWTVDENGYYSDTDRRYLTYTNPHLKTRHGINQERDALLNALSIGYLLNRTVILPAFHCFETRGYFCRSNQQECSLLPLYHVETFDKYFDNAYREHAFLSHDLVPAFTRQSRTNSLYIDSKYQARVQPSVYHNKTIRGYVPANKLTGATPAEIRKWFSDVKEIVLVFHNLYGAFAGFEMTPETADIRERLKKALKRCNYRQRRCDYTTWFKDW